MKNIRLKLVIIFTIILFISIKLNLFIGCILGMIFGIIGGPIAVIVCSFFGMLVNYIFI